jgi:hypothetical protein
MKLGTLFIVLILLGVGLGFFNSYVINIYSEKLETQSFEFDMVVEAGKSGFNLDSDKIHFGVVCKSCSSKRYFNYTNNFDFPVKIEHIAKLNEGKNDFWIDFISEENFIVSPGERISIDVIAKTGPETTEEWKKGNITFEVYRAKPFAAYLK